MHGRTHLNIKRLLAVQFPHREKRGNFCVKCWFECIHTQDVSGACATKGLKECKSQPQSGYGEKLKVLLREGENLSQIENLLVFFTAGFHAICTQTNHFGQNQIIANRFCDLVLLLFPVYSTFYTNEYIRHYVHIWEYTEALPINKSFALLRETVLGYTKAIVAYLNPRPILCAKLNCLRFEYNDLQSDSGSFPHRESKAVLIWISLYPGEVCPLFGLIISIPFPTYSRLMLIHHHNKIESGNCLRVSHR